MGTFLTVTKCCIYFPFKLAIQVVIPVWQGIMFKITFHNSYFSGEKTPCFSSDKDFVSFEIAHKCRP